MQVLKIARRSLLGAALVGGGLALGTTVLRPSRARSAPSRLNVYVEITPQDEVLIYTPSAEMGQGVSDSLPKIVAEEMDADWSRVRVRLSGADPRFASPVNHLQRTSSSDAVSSYYDALRLVGAAARAMLVEAAAARWDRPVAECSVIAGVIAHGPSGRRLRFGEVAAEAAKRSPPATVALKDPARFTLIGRSFPRKDLPAKVNGSAVFGIDVDLPNMAFAAIRHCPTFGGRFARYDRAALGRAPGVLAVVDLDHAVAVVAESFWQAKTALEAADLKAVGGDPALSSSSLSAAFARALDDDAAAVPAAAPAKSAPRADSGSQRFTADYEAPYLAHATLEPPCCTALVETGKCTLWAPLQAADAPRAAVARLLGLPLDRVELNRTYIGGGFGRKWEHDFALEAVEIARAFPGRPVKLIWTREEDIRHDTYRPGYRVRTRAVLDARGRISSLHSRIAGQSVFASKGRPLPKDAPDPVAAMGLISEIYDIPDKRIEFVAIAAPIPVGFWRGVMASQNDFFSETAIDELADLAGQDPVAFRQAMLGPNARVSAVLARAAKRAGWGAPLPPGRGRGVAIGFDKGSAWAQIAEVRVAGAEVGVERITCAFDCGLQIDPRNIEAQLQGGIIFGLTAALRGEIHFEAGATVEENFGAYPMVRFADTPRIDIVLVNSDAPPGGVGELGTPGVAPAVCNAIKAATGKRLRRLPVSAHWAALAADQGRRG